MNTEAIRDRQASAIRALIPEHQQRLTWSRDQIAQHQRDRLRSMVALAQQRSPWHRARLAGVSPDTLELTDLARLPVMTKGDLMRDWDQIVTEPGLTLARCTDFIDGQEDFGYLDDDGRQAFASGGSSGRRGVYVWDEQFFATSAMVAFRYQYRDDLARGVIGRPRRRAVITAGVPPHASTPLFSARLDPAEQVAVFSVLLPFDQLAERVGRARPDHLIGYPSMIHRLAEAQARGQLDIAPSRVSTNSEPLTDEARAAFESVWGATVTNMWGSTEVGMHAIACDRSPGLHLAEDVLIIERVDAANRPVPDPEAADKLLVTSLIQATFPFLRYELADAVTLLDAACDCGSPMRLIADIAGRADDDFDYPGAGQVPAAAFRHALSTVPTVEEYQVRQTEHGAVVAYLGSVADPTALSARIEAELRSYGLAAPEVTLRAADRLPRDPRTGKLRRFVPLPQR